MLVLDQYIDMNYVLRHCKPKGVIEVGAYLGEMWRTYEKWNIKNRLWIEADICVFHELKKIVPENDICLNMLISDKEEERLFNIVNNFQSSSMLKLKEHLRIFPNYTVVEQRMMKTTTLDKLIERGIINIENYDFLLMDVQGAEYFVIKGFEKNIHKIKALVAEVNYAELYEGCMMVNDFNDYMESLGFKKIIEFKHTIAKWGDIYYTKM